MSQTHTSPTDQHEPGLHVFRIKGHLDDHWADWFNGLSLSRENGGTTILYGPLVDQAAFHGVLASIRDLGLPIVSVECVIPDREGAQA